MKSTYVIIRTFLLKNVVFGKLHVDENVVRPWLSLNNLRRSLLNFFYFGCCFVVTKCNNQLDWCCCILICLSSNSVLYDMQHSKMSFIEVIFTCNLQCYFFIDVNLHITFTEYERDYIAIYLQHLVFGFMIYIFRPSKSTDTVIVPQYFNLH